MSRTKWIIAGAVIALAVVAVIGLSGSPSTRLVNGDEFARLAAEGIRVIDVRTPSEFASAHINGAENVPMSSLVEAAKSWDRDEPLALYCATGARSADAARTLQTLGFSEVYDLSGGIIVYTGEIVTGSGVASTPPPAAQPSALPVMYEFYTDW